MTTTIANLGALTLLIAAALFLARRRGLPLLPVCLALSALLFSPLVAYNLGQPGIVPMVVNCLAILAALTVDDRYGILVAVALINGPSFIFAIALLLLARSARVLVGLAAGIASLWLTHWRPEVSEWIVQPWSDFVHHPITNALIPYASAHIGLHVALLEILATVSWPLLLASAAALWTLRNDLPHDRRTLAVAALAAAFVVQQLVIAPFDTPNDPRRAIPAAVAIGIAWCWAAARLWPRRAWRVVIVAVLAICALAVALRSPAIRYTSTAASIEANPKEPVSAAFSSRSP